MADTTPKSYSTDPTLYLYTSLTAGSSHIITATSRLETILKANKIPFRALDVATDEKARMLWGRRSKGKKLPGLVKFGSIVGDLEEIEEWNEYGELKQQIGMTPAVDTKPVTSSTSTPSKPPQDVPSTSDRPPVGAKAPSSEHILIQEPPEGERRSGASGPKKDDTPLTMAMRQAGAEAAQRAGQKKVEKSRAFLSEKPLSKDSPIPATETKLGKAAADPEQSAVVTGAKTPGQPASEGAAKTSIGKMAESESRNDVEDASPVSKEESLLQGRRASSITKQKTLLSNETALDSSSHLPEQRFEQRPREHRGSNISEASKEEIACIEKSQSIPEEVEEAEDDTAATSEKKSAHQIETKSDILQVAASDKGEGLGMKDEKPQGQDAKEGDAAGVSVGD